MATREKKSPGEEATVPAKKAKRPKQSPREKFLIQSKYGVHSRVGVNLASRMRFRAKSPSLTDAQQRVVSDLSSRGIAMAHFSELVGDEALWEDLSGDIGRFAAETEATLEKGDYDKKFAEAGYLVRRGWRQEPIPIDSPWLRLAASPKILDVVNAYRGLWTKLIDLEKWYTIPTPDAADRVASQNWHRDPGDVHVVKVFTYFVDVDEEAGPFQYIPGSPKGGQYGGLWPWRPFMPGYPPQQELRDRISEDEVVTATGQAGTIIFCDTSGFHRGGFAKSKPRVLSYQTYVSPASVSSRLSPRRFKLGALEAQADLAPQVRFALD